MILTCISNKRGTVGLWEQTFGEVHDPRQSSDGDDGLAIGNLRFLQVKLGRSRVVLASDEGNKLDHLGDLSVAEDRWPYWSHDLGIVDDLSIAPSQISQSDPSPLLENLLLRTNGRTFRENFPGQLRCQNSEIKLVKPHE